jgi:hypothetical protein
VLKLPWQTFSNLIIVCCYENEPTFLNIDTACNKLTSDSFFLSGGLCRQFTKQPNYRKKNSILSGQKKTSRVITVEKRTQNSYFYIKCAKRVFFVHEKVFYAETKVEAV